MKFNLVLTLLLIFNVCFSVFGQMTENGTTYYGNEWIKNGQVYLRFNLTEDGVYRLTFDQLNAAGLTAITGSEIQLFRNGVEVPITTSSEGVWSSADYLTFMGYKNKSELDKYLYPNGLKDSPNPATSLYSDSAVYFITLDPSSNHLRTKIELNDLSNLPTAEPYILVDQIISFNTGFASVYISYNVYKIEKSVFEGGNGMVSADPNISVPFDLPHLNKTASLPIINYRGVTNSPSFNHLIDFNINSTKIDSIRDFGSYYYNRTFTDNNRILQEQSNSFSITTPITTSDYFNLGYLKISYPRNTILGNDARLSFKIKDINNTNRFLAFKFENSSPRSGYLTDSIGSWKINGVLVGNELHFNVPANISNHQISLILDNQSINNAEQPKLVNLKSFDVHAFNYLIISDKRLMAGASSAVQEYAEYRSSMEGGRYKVEVVDVEDIYDSFLYGNRNNPLSIKNFVNYLSLTEDSLLVFIIGRGRDFKDLRTPSQLAEAVSLGYAVPTYCNFGSDNLMVSKSFQKLDMVCGVGRLPAVNQDEVRDYLTRIKQSDAEYAKPGTALEKLWTKKVLQLNGGKVGQTDFSQIANHQNNAYNEFSTNLFAGVNDLVNKTTDNAVGNPKEEIFDKINAGVAIVDYFGHGAATTLSIPLDFPGKYKNNPKLPILMIKGCKSGNCHVSGKSFATTFLYSKDYGYNGYRAMLGSISYSYIGPLANIEDLFYKELGGNYYGRELGNVVRASLSNPLVNTLNEAHQMIYAGDPAIRINALPGSDFVVKENSIRLEPEAPTVYDEKFKVKFEISNIGRGYSDTLFYTIQYENSAKKIIETISRFIVNPTSENVVEAELTLDKFNLSGENTIYITIDPTNKVNELPAPYAENNNEYYSGVGTKGYKFYIKSSNITPIYPNKYSIVGKQKIKISAFIDEITNTENLYHFEIDTTDYFNSPSKETYQLLSKPGHIEWEPNMTLQDSLVYFWRVTRDSLSEEQPKIQTISNFTYIPNASGFSESHNGQWRTNQNLNLKIEGGGNNLHFGLRDNGKFDFKSGLFNPNVQELFGGSRDNQFLESMNIFKRFKDYPNGVFGVYWLIDSSNIKFYDPGSNYGSVPLPDGGNSSFLAFDPSIQQSRIDMVNFIENIIDQKGIFVVMSRMNPGQTLHPEDWDSDATVNNGKTIYNVLQSFGSTKIENMRVNGSQPYIGIFDKRNNSVISETIAENSEAVSAVVYIHVQSHYGSTSQVFGPAKQWEYFEWEPQAIPVLPLDVVDITLKGLHYQDDSKDTIIFESKGVPNQKFSYDLTNLDTKRFPNLKYELYALDNTRYEDKMDGFKYVRIIGQELPEAAILGSQYFLSVPDTIYQGQSIHFRIPGKNIGSFDMDSMLVKLSLKNLSGISEDIYQRFDSLKVDSTGHYSFDMNIKSLNGKVQLIADLNPNNDQPESNHINNLFIKDLYINGDTQNPLLDVTFDGEHILNGDIVSSTPLIKIKLKDENKIFALKDSNLINLYLVDSTLNEVPIYLNDPRIKFYPADENNLQNKNEAIIEFRPTFDYNFTYKLKLTARDQAGNYSGDNVYEISFKVILEKSISNIFNYPNPFSNATRFVYTLTGNELPTYYKIQIMTLSGKVVREITQSELGPLKVGKHLTDFVWNGTDEFGDKLANGVYLYRMITKDQNKKKYAEFDLDGNGRNADPDSFFTGGWGKLVIIR